MGECPRCEEREKVLARLRELWRLANCEDKETWEKALDEINDILGNNNKEPWTSE